MTRKSSTTTCSSPSSPCKPQVPKATSGGSKKSAFFSRKASPTSVEDACEQQMAAIALRQFMEDLEIEKEVEQAQSSSTDSVPFLSPEEEDLRIKEEKMKASLGKLKLHRDRRRKSSITIDVENSGLKDVSIDEDMTCAMVCHLLAVKNHADESPHWEMIERIGDMGLERVLEDHLNVVDIHTSWPRDSKNVFIFKKNPGKWDFIENPERFFPSSPSVEAKSISKDKHPDCSKKVFGPGLFSSGHMPEVEGVLFMKDGYKKPWKKFYFVLRASGLYHSTKGKSTAPEHLAEVASLHSHELYTGADFQKAHSSPSPYCFCLKPHRGSSNPATAKDVKVFCAETAQFLVTWMAGVRMAKYGSAQLYSNYKAAMSGQIKELMLQKELEKMRESSTLVSSSSSTSLSMSPHVLLHSPSGHSDGPDAHSSPFSPHSPCPSLPSFTLAEFQRMQQQSPVPPLAPVSPRSTLPRCSSTEVSRFAPPVASTWSRSNSPVCPPHGKPPSPSPSPSSPSPTPSPSPKARLQRQRRLAKTSVSSIDNEPTGSQTLNLCVPAPNFAHTLVNCQTEDHDDSFRNSCNQSPQNGEALSQISGVSNEKCRNCDNSQPQQHPSTSELPTRRNGMQNASDKPKLPPRVPNLTVVVNGSNGTDWNTTALFTEPNGPAHSNSLQSCSMDGDRSPGSSNFDVFLPPSPSPSTDGLPSSRGVTPTVDNRLVNEHVSVDQNGKIEDSDWFHGAISREEAQIRLQTVGLQNGVFVIRNSTSINGCFVLTMYANGLFKNFAIRKQGAQVSSARFFIDDGPRFPSLDHLITYYSFNTDGIPCTLSRFAPRHQASTRRSTAGLYV